MVTGKQNAINAAAKQLASEVEKKLASLIAQCEIQPRNYQRRIISSAIKMFGGDWLGADGNLTKPAASVLIESPTGSGKTVMGLAVAKLLQQSTGCRVGWVAMRRNLLSQAQCENEARHFNVEMQTISMFDKEPPAVDLLIVDEAQHDAATSMSNLHSHIRPQWVLGLSATPYRSDRIKLCFDQIIRDAGIAQLIQDGFLSQYHHYTIPKYEPSQIGRLLIDDPQRWGPSLVFFHRVSECDQLKSILKNAGVSCNVVTAKTNREQQLRDFESGKTRVLINMAILTEGFDCPHLKTVFCRPSTKGCTIQMAGRVLRKCHSQPTKQVVQCQKTPHPMLKTAMASEQYVWMDGKWKSIAMNAQLDSMAAAARRRISRTKVELPRLVSMNRSRKPNWLTESNIDE